LDALTVVAEGAMPGIAKPLAGLGSGVMELASRPPRRCVSRRLCLADRRRNLGVSRLPKKSKTGIKTPKSEIDLVRERLKRLRDASR